MTDLAPCARCNRHVAIVENVCPFCKSALPPMRARLSMPRRLTRAAIFTAAIAACSDPKPSPTPQGRATGKADDLEKLLDHDESTVHHAAAPADASIDIRPPAIDATQIAVAVDAGVPADAGVDQQALAEKRRRDAERKRRERERLQQLQIENTKIKVHHNAKPYGAPPARRRIV